MTGLSAALALLFASIAFPASHGASGAQEAGDMDIVEFDQDRYERMTVPVRLADEGPYRFLVDTGSQNTVIARR